MSAEATCFLVDLSPRMVESGHAQRVIPYIERILFEKCKKGRKTDWVSYYLANYSATKNELNIEGVFQVMNLTTSLSFNSMVELMRKVRKIIPEVELDNDGINSMDKALLLAALEMKRMFGKRKVFKQIVCFVDPLIELKLEEDEITELLKEYTGRFILVDCGGNSRKSPHYNELSLQGENPWKNLIERCPNSFSWTLDEVLEYGELVRPAEVKPVRVFTGFLRLGADIELITGSRTSEDFSTDFPHLSIRVEGYPATKSVQSLNRKAYIKVSGEKNAKHTPGHGNPSHTEYVPALSGIEYEIHNSRKREASAEREEVIKEQTTVSKGKSEEEYDVIAVSKEAITKAYRYGSDYVVLPPVLVNHLYIDTAPGIDIRGFIDIDSLPRHYLTGESVFIFADTRIGSDADSLSFSALVVVMVEERKVAIARYVSKESAGIQMCVLVPLLIQTEDGDPIATLILNRLPFAEDERISDFPKLSQRRTTSGKLLPRDGDIQEEVDNLMSEFIDNLDSDEEESAPDTSPYYRQLRENAADTTISLPTRKDGLFEEYTDSDRLSMAAIIPHRMQQLLSEYVHRLIVDDKDTNANTYISELPHGIREKLIPHKHDKFDSSKLTRILGVRKVAATDSQAEVHKDNTNSYIATQEGLPLEDLLRLGRKEER